MRTRLGDLIGTENAETLSKAVGDTLEAVRRVIPDYQTTHTVLDSMVAATAVVAVSPEYYRSKPTGSAFRALSSHAGFYYNWQNAGRPVFHLSPALTASLLLTDCKGLVGRDVRWPYRAMLLVINGAEISIDSHKVAYVYMTQEGCVPTEQQKDFVHAAEAQFPHFTGLKHIVDTAKARLPKSTRTLDDIIAITEGPEQGALYKQARTPLDDELIDDWLRGGLDGMERRTMKSIEALNRIIANFCVYIANTKRPPAEKQSTVLKRDREQRATIYKVGGDIQLPAHLVQAARDVCAGTTSPRWRISRRYTVRGHWRNQAHGPQRSLRTKKWIQPHWKGPTTAEALERIYQTKTTEE